MNVTSPFSIPFYKGLSLIVEPGHEEHLRIALANISTVTDAINRFQSSPLLTEFMDITLSRFLRENNYAGKSEHMLRARMEKLKIVLTQDNPTRRVAELDRADVQRLKDQLPSLLKQNAASCSKGANLTTYYQLFNRMLDEALESKLITEAIKVATCNTKHAEITKPFLDSNLNQMFSGWPYRKYLAGDMPKIYQDAKPYRFWLLPLGLYTGARLNELCQLRVHDVIQDVHCVDLIDINDNGYDKSLKTGPSARQIPICSKLVEMGFLKFVEERRQAEGNDALLFNELSFDSKHLYSRDPSRFFCGPCTGTGYIGQHCPPAVNGGLNFKSFRRSFAVRLERSGIPPSTIAYLLGHEGGAPEVTADHYLERPLSLRLLEQMERGLTYNVQTERIRWEHFKNLLANQAGRGKRGRRTKQKPY